MRSRTTFVFIVAATFLLCQAVCDQATARVVRDGNAPISNPAIEVGGHRLPSAPHPQVDYSMLGAVASESSWIMQCALWPWRQFESLAWFRHRGPQGVRRARPRPPLVPVP